MSVDGIYHSACYVGRGDYGSGEEPFHFSLFWFLSCIKLDFNARNRVLPRKI